jgi:hypothetical protein
LSLEANNGSGHSALGRVYIIMAAVGSLSVAVPELLNHLLDAGVSVGPLPFLILAITGAWATRVASIGYGAVGGAIVGFALSLVGGAVYLIVRPPEPATAVRVLLSSIIITTVLGCVLGALGGLPVWLLTFRRRSAEKAN